MSSCACQQQSRTALLYACSAAANIVIDGCPQDCARKCFDQAGLTNYLTLRVTDLGIEKTKAARAAPEQVARVVARARQLIAKS